MSSAWLPVGCPPRFHQRKPPHHPQGRPRTPSGPSVRLSTQQQLAILTKNNMPRFLSRPKSEKILIFGRLMPSSESNPGHLAYNKPVPDFLLTSTMSVVRWFLVGRRHTIERSLCFLLSMQWGKSMNRRGSVDRGTLCPVLCKKDGLAV